MHGQNARDLSKVAVVALVAACLISGCGPYRARVQTKAMMANQQLMLQGFGTSVSTSAVKLRADRLEGGQLAVVMQLIREHLDSAFVEVKVVFLDDKGIQLEETNWQPVRLDRDVITQHKVVSLSAAAHDFRIIVRNTDD